jgi:hypothetical protein
VNHPQVLIYETDGCLAELLRNLAREQRWALREPRRAEACFTLLQGGGPAVLVIRVGGDLVRQMTLLEQVAWLFPETATVVVSDEANEMLAGLAWDLGASYVLFPPQPRDRLPGLVAELMGIPLRGGGERSDKSAVADA